MSQSQTAPQAAPQVVETPANQQPTTPSPAPSEDPRIQQLIKKERALTAKLRTLSQEKQTLTEAQSKWQQEKASYLSRDYIKANPYKALAEAGITPEMLANPPSPAEMQMQALKQEIESLKGQLAESNTKIDKRADESYQAALKQIGHDAKALIDSDERFELTKNDNAHKAVVDLIERTYQEDGVLLSVEEAAQEVEAYLTERALTLAKLKKVQEKLAPAPDTSQQGQQSTQVQKSPTKTITTPKTLTQSVVQASAHTLSSKDRRERAIAAFKGQLK